MSFPPIYQDLFQDGGGGDLLRPDIIPNTLATENPDVFPEIVLTGDTAGSAKVGSDGKYTVDNITAATSLKNARTIRTNLASTSTASFDGTANITPGVDGILPKANGGTGNSTGNSDTATALATGRTIRTNLASTSTATFDGTANITPGVTGTLPIGNGGTGNVNGTAVSWTNSRTLTLSGNVSGSASIKGDANVTLSTTIASLPSGTQGSTWASGKLLKTLSPGTAWTTTADGYFVVHSSGSKEGSGGKTNWGVKATVGGYSWGMIYGSHYSYGTDTCVWPVKKGYSIKIAALDGGTPNSYCTYQYFSAE